MEKEELIEYLGEMEDLSGKIPRLLQQSYDRIDTIQTRIRRSGSDLTADEISEISSSQVFQEKASAFYLRPSFSRGISQEILEIQQEIEELLEAERKLLYLTHCIEKLPSVDAEFITALLIKKECAKSYARRTGISAPTLSRRRKRAVEHLLALYNQKFDSGQPGEQADEELREKR